ncbi:hypothetical protein E0494_02805 [Marinilabiliaceae bacterium JC040]|nr:hypothetical protein [Marinilabiliaceae bacterium JC040]
MKNFCLLKIASLIAVIGIVWGYVVITQLIGWDMIENMVEIHLPFTVFSLAVLYILVKIKFGFKLNK